MSFWESIDNALGLPNRSRDERHAKHAKAEASKIMNEQVKAYKEQSELTRQELNNKRNESAFEKRRVEEKQVRALRRNYRSAGFLGSRANEQSDMSSTLGG